MLASYGYMIDVYAGPGRDQAASKYHDH